VLRSDSDALERNPYRIPEARVGVSEGNLKHADGWHRCLANSSQACGYCSPNSQILNIQEGFCEKCHGGGGIDRH
jgi:hypothetical protein